MGFIKQIKVGSDTHNIRDDRIITLADNGTTTAGVWLAKVAEPAEAITAYKDGQLFLYKITKAGASTTTLNINGLGAKTVYRSATSKLTTHFGVGNYLLLAYNSTNTCFRVVNFYDSNTTYSVATTDANGLMSKEDKAKLDTISSNYVIASTTGNDGVTGSITNNGSSIYIDSGNDSINVIGGGDDHGVGISVGDNNFVNFYQDRTEMIDVPVKIKQIQAPTASNGTTYGLGTSGQVLKSNGTSVYWANDSTTSYSSATSANKGVVQTFKFYNNAATYAGTLPGSPDTSATPNVNATSTTSGRYYGVEADKNGRLFVNVPWSNTTYSSKAAASGGTATSLVTTGEKYTWNNKADKTTLSVATTGSYFTISGTSSSNISFTLPLSRGNMVNIKGVKYAASTSSSNVSATTLSASYYGFVPWDELVKATSVNLASTNNSSATVVTMQIANVYDNPSYSHSAGTLATPSTRNIQITLSFKNSKSATTYAKAWLIYELDGAITSSGNSYVA